MPYLHHIAAINTTSTVVLGSMHTQEPGALSDAACKARKVTGDHKRFESARSPSLVPLQPQTASAT
jgi:hypothetical protein